MIESGFIHFECLCGADLFYLTSYPEKYDLGEARNTLIQLLNHPNYAIFTAQDGHSADCPHCGALVELPDPETVAYLRRLSWQRLQRANTPQSTPVRPWSSAS